MQNILFDLREKTLYHVRRLSKENWTFLFVTAISVFCLFHFVDLKPQVDEHFFFSDDDLQFQTEHKIAESFIRKDAQIIISVTGDIESEEYMALIGNLSDSLMGLEGITGVKSISHGPNNLKDAVDSPLWKRLLISDDKKSTNLIVLVEDSVAQQIVPDIETVVGQYTSDQFNINVSGLPYILELIRRHLLKDLIVFSTLAFIIFGAVVYLIFRSKCIVFGTMLSCLNACIWTFMITDLLSVPIGLLTANLATIIFVLTLSHIVFLTFNWKRLPPKEQNSMVKEALRMTFPASCWSMLTTLLGFLSLILVPAKPLKDLGIAGAVGTLLAFATAYGIYPSFLKMTQPRIKKSHSGKNRIYEFLEMEQKSIRLVIFIFCLVALPGLWTINTDPSMLSFFSKRSDIYSGLEYIDRNGGSSPLVLVVQSKDGETLNSQAAYEKLWRLQGALEAHRSVGSVISLPVLMAQAKQAPLAKVLFWEWLLEILEKPQFDEIAKSFITQDRKYGLFLIRMNEQNRVKKRLTIIGEIKQIVETQGFTPELMGGVYVLQGHMAKLITASLIGGLSKLMALFALIAWIISRSLRITTAIILSLGLIPIGILGLIGLYRIPLDVISSPASNVAIAMGIDSMIHMIKSYRRKKHTGSASWQEVRNELWQPILTSMLIVSTGFSIFLFSTFPPTQRFGIAIVFGTIFASLTALYIMPYFVQFTKKA